MKPFFLFLVFATPLWAETSDQSPKVPAKFEFIRSLELEGSVFAAGREELGAQSFRVETRYLDPDVNAFVGLIIMGTRFNERLSLAESTEPFQGRSIWNWGAAVGMVRGRHLWAIDLMGANIGEHLAFGPALVGEHSFGKRWKLFHRTAVDFFAGDTVLDSDQGLLWSPWKSVGFTVGYRIFMAINTSRNGPRAGMTLRFDVPKFPFIFPSIG